MKVFQFCLWSRSALICLLTGVGTFAAVECVDALTITRSEEPVSSEDVKIERWRFERPDPLTIQYKRGQGSPSLPDGDSGVGLWGGGSFSNWYVNNTIRVLINDVDIFAESPAASIEFNEGDSGCLRMTWLVDQDPKKTVILDWSVPSDGDVVYARIQIAPEIDVEKLQVTINCFPGGFAPAEQGASQRWISTEKNECEIAEFSDLAPTLPFSAGEQWIFYADKLASEGSLALLLKPEEKASGEVLVTKYQQITTLDFPPKLRELHFGFFAFNSANDEAKSSFLRTLPAEQKRLAAAKFFDKN